jgi:hypothetical protein
MARNTLTWRNSWRGMAVSTLTRSAAYVRPEGGSGKSVSDLWPTQVAPALTVSAPLCQDTPSPPVQRGRFPSGSDEPQMSVSR